jgi:magnesium transporter
VLNNIKSFEEITSSLDNLHVVDIQNAEHPSHMFKTDKYDLLIIRFFELDKDGLKGVSSSYLIKNDGIYEYEIGENNFLQLEGHHSIINSIESRLRQSEFIVKKYVEETDKLEDGLYTRKISSIFLDVWFDLKKDLTRVDRILERAGDVLKEYALTYGKEKGFPQDSLSDVLEHIERYQRLASLNTAKLDTLYNYYNSLKNDKINNNIYALTVCQACFCR